MSQMNQYQQQDHAQQQRKSIKFRERLKWRDEELELVHNPYDKTRSQIRPDYERLEAVKGSCSPIQMLDPTTNKPKTQYLLLAKVKDPAEPGSLVPDKYYRCWRVYDLPIHPKAVDWRTVVFYEIKNDKSDADEAQDFINTLLQASRELDEQQSSQDEPDSTWAEDFAQLQLAAVSGQPAIPDTQPEAAEHDEE